MFVHTRIATVISHSGLTKTAFGQRIGLSQPMVSRLTSGSAPPTDRTIADICREFGVSETWLRTGEGEMYVLPDAQVKLVNFCADVLSGVSGPVRRQFVELLASLDDRQLEVAAEIMDWIVENWKKENDTEK